MATELLFDADIPLTIEFYKDLLDHMSDGVYFVDRNRRILYWNQGATRLTGYHPEEIVGRRCDNDTLCHLDETGKHLWQLARSRCLSAS